MKLLHGNHIVHGDISETNIKIQVDASGKYKAVFLDFDYTRFETQPTLKRFVPLHHAPELIEQIPAHPRQDIYGLGLMLQFFHEINCYENFMINKLIKDMLQDNPSSRYSIDQLIEQLQKIINIINLKDEPLNDLIKYYYAKNGFANTLRFIDVTWSLNPAVYKNALLCLNKIYRVDYCEQEVSKSCLGWNSIFGLRHKNKHLASELAEQYAQNPYILHELQSEYPEFRNGKVADIVKRLVLK